MLLIEKDLSEETQYRTIESQLKKCKKYKNAKKFLNDFTKNLLPLKIVWEVITFNKKDYFASIITHSGNDLLTVDSSSKKKATKKLAKLILNKINCTI